ncbi:hypothetical protein OQA88_795 [Cercophora sp. LCS_1]
MRNPSASLGAAQANGTSVVYVLSETTVYHTRQPLWTHTVAAAVSSENSSTVRFQNSTSSAGQNVTSAGTVSGNRTTSGWLNISSTSLILGTGTRPIWLNTSMPSLKPNTTTGRWLNTTFSTPTALANFTSVRWPNSTTTALLSNSTSVRWPNTTMHANTTAPRWANTTTTPTATPTPTVDTTCGETVSQFAVQVSQPGGTFDSWFLLLIGNSLLFTNTRSSASSFSVEGSGHLCVVGYVDEKEYPAIAAVGVHDASSNVWLLRRRTLDSLPDDYTPVKCSSDEASLRCSADMTSQAAHWLSCGLQLDLSTDGNPTVPVGGRNCTSISLKVV